MTWHYEGHYILTDSEPQEIVAEKVSEANRGLIASAPTQQAKIEALADALELALKHAFHDTYESDFEVVRNAARRALVLAGRIP